MRAYIHEAVNTVSTWGVSAIMVAGIWPAACMLLYCMGVMCSKPGGGTSQYREGFLRAACVEDGTYFILLLALS